NTLTNRLLHPPTAALREAALSGDAELGRAAIKLFPAAAATDPSPDTQDP
ncbi:MAG TPA: glutamyl-tRNA reductase, partial [Pseudoxanthomonas sp.]|nr:glutamyl-tRNA reductase [Pseudoxanthomonas sp.]